MAIIIAAMGLFGLITYAAEQRAKEIGIRKVMGASVGGIVALLSKDFLKLVTVAIVIAIPLAYILMNRWLQDFTYRANIGWVVFVIAALVAITFATISVRVIKAAITWNPTCLPLYIHQPDHTSKYNRTDTRADHQLLHDQSRQEYDTPR